MKRKAAVIAMTATLIGASLAGGAFASTPDAATDAPRQMNCRKHGHDFMAKWAKALDLTADQQSRIKALVEGERQSTAPLHKQLAEGRKDLRQALQPATFNEAAARSLLASQASVRADLVIAHAKLRQQIFALLTPAQQQEAAKLRGLMGGPERGHHRHGGW